MIDSTQFEGQFLKLCAAFSVSKGPAIMDAWADEFEDCDYFTLCKAFKRLQHGERFPTWGVVWDTYKPLLPDNLREKESEGCDDCEHGRVFYVDYILCRPGESDSDRVLSYSLVANCAGCSQDVLSNAVNLHRPRLQRQGNGEYWTQRALNALPAELEKVEKYNIARRLEWKKDRFSMRRSFEDG